MGNPVSELRGVICCMGSDSVTCYPTQVNTPHLNPSQKGWYSIYLLWRDGRLTWPKTIDYAMAVNQTRDRLIESPHPWPLCHPKSSTVTISSLLHHFQYTAIYWPKITQIFLPFSINASGSTSDSYMQRQNCRITIVPGIHEWIGTHNSWQKLVNMGHRVEQHISLIFFQFITELKL